MSKLAKFIGLAFVGVIILWLITDPESLAATINVILGGLRTAAERLITFVQQLSGGQAEG